MALKAAKPSLASISRSLKSAQDSRTYLIKNTRDAISLCSQSIILVHSGNILQAKAKAKKASQMIAKYRPKAQGSLAHHMVMPEQEYVEACALIAVAQKRDIPAQSALRVSDAAYVLGLLDCIGELKRMALDRLRTGNLAEAERVFGIMEEMFAELYPFAALDKVVREARKKLDVARILLEGTRSVITEEVRRQEFVRAITERK